MSIKWQSEKKATNRKCKYLPVDLPALRASLGQASVGLVFLSEAELGPVES